MQCREFETRLQGDLDLRREVVGDADLDAHAALCAECAAKREFFVQLARLTNSLASRQVRSLPTGTYDRERLIRAAVARSRTDLVTLPEREDRPRRVSYALSSSIAAVAACLALWVGLSSWNRPEAPQNGPSVANVSPTESVVATTPQPLDAPAIDVPTSPRVAVLREDDPTLEFARWGRSSLAGLSDDPAMQRHLRPIASSFGVAWDTVRRALPSASSAAGAKNDQANSPVLGAYAAV